MNGHARCIRLVLADFVPSEKLNSLSETAAVTAKSKSEQRFFVWIPSSMFVRVLIDYNRKYDFVFMGAVHCLNLLIRRLMVESQLFTWLR